MLIALSLALCAAALALAPLGWAISTRMDRLRDSIIGRLEDILGCDLAYGRLSPSLLRAFRIEDLELRDRDGGGRLLVAERAEISLSLRLRGLGLPALGLRRLKVSGAAIDVNAVLDSGILDSLRRLADLGSGTQPGDLALDLRDCRATYSADGLSLALDDLDVDATLLSSGVEAWADGSLRAEGPSLPLAGPWQGRLSLSGSASAHMDMARLVLEASGGGRDFYISPQTILLTKKGSLLSARKIEDAAPLDAWADLDLASGSFKAKADFDAFRPAALGGLRGAWAAYAPWLGANATGTASVSGNFKGGALTYALKGDISPPQGLIDGAYRLSIDASGIDKKLRISRALIRGAAGEAWYTGDFDMVSLDPEGELGMDLSVEGYDIRTTFLLGKEGRHYTLFSEGLSVANTDFSAVSLSLLPSGKGLDFSLEAYMPRAAEKPAPLLPFEVEAGMGGFQAPPLTIKGSLGLGSAPYLEAEAVLTAFPSQALLDLAAPFMTLPSGQAAQVASSFTIGAEVYLTSDFSDFSYTAPQVILSYDLKPGNYGVLSISGTRESLALTGLSLFWDGHELKGKGQADFGSQDMTEFLASLSFAGQNLDLRGELYGREQLFLHGSHGLEFRGSLVGPEILFSLSASEFPLPLTGYGLKLSLDASGRFRSLADFSLNLGSAKIEHESGILPTWAALSFSGGLDQNTARLESLTFEDQHSVLNGRAELGYSLGKGASIRVDAELASGLGEYYLVDAALGPEGLSGNLRIRESPIARIRSMELAGAVNADISLSGNIKDPKLSFSGSLSRGSFLGIPLALKLSGRLSGEKLSLWDLDAAYFLFSLSKGSLEYDIAADSASVDSPFTAKLGPNDLKARLRASGKLLSQGRAAPVLAGSLDALSFGPFRSASWPLRLSILPESIEFSGGPKGEARLAILPSGQFEANLDSPLALRGRAGGIIKDGRISAQAPALVADFPQLWQLFGNPAVEFKAGTLRASISLEGSPQDPEMSGKGRAEGVVCRVPAFLPGSFGPFSTDMVLSSNLLKMPETLMTSGASQVLGSLEMSLEHWLPARTVIRLRTPKDSSVDAASKISGLDINGRGRFDLTLTFQPADWSLRGAVSMDEGSILLSEEGQEGGGEQRGSDYPLLADLSLRFGKKVEFLWPNRQLPFLRASIDATDSSLAMSLDGIKERYSLKGAAVLRGGEVIYFKRSFYLKEGRLLFNESSDFFDPLLSFRAEMREQADSGPVTVILSMDQSRLSQWRPTLQSQPPLSQNDILALLGGEVLGLAAGKGETINPSEIGPRMAASAADVIAQTSLVRRWEGGIRDALGLDLFSIRSPLVQNILLGAILSPGDIDRQSDLGRYFDGTTISAGKYVGADLFVQTLAQIKTDQDALIGNVGMDLEFNLEFNTPYFTLLYSFAPQLEHSDSLFVGDQSIGVYWQIPY